MLQRLRLLRQSRHPTSTLKQQYWSSLASTRSKRRRPPDPEALAAALAEEDAEKQLAAAAAAAELAGPQPIDTFLAAAHEYERQAAAALAAQISAASAAKAIAAAESGARSIARLGQLLLGIITPNPTIAAIVRANTTSFELATEHGALGLGIAQQELARGFARTRALDELRGGFAADTPRMNMASLPPARDARAKQLAIMAESVLTTWR